jgi:hypothetical protein
MNGPTSVGPFFFEAIMVKIKFTAQGANSIVGGFGPGDKASVSEAFARHLVEEARVAVYDAAPSTSASAESVVAARVGRKPKQPKE